MKINSLRKKTPMLLFLALLLAVPAFAQTSASLNGTVHDGQGGAVVGAKVTLKDVTGRVQLETTTNAEGIYNFPIIEPSTYTVTIEATGFKKSIQSGIVVNASDRQSTGTTVLEVGDISNTVEVTADSAQLLLKTESGEQGAAVNNQQIQNLAINGRNYLDLLKVTPGVVTTTNFAVAGPGGLSNINIDGTRSGKNNLTIDGTTNVDTGSNGSQHVALTLDNVAEFKVLSSNYQAEYGRSAGGAIQIVTKSGTSQFHGTGYLFHRHEDLNANSFFNNANGENAAGAENNPRNFYRYNQAGYNIGGPVLLPKKALKDKLFFFFSQEYQRQLQPQGARQSRVPTAAEISGDFSNSKDGNGQQIYITNPSLVSSTNLCQATPSSPRAGINYQGACFYDPLRATAANPTGLNILPSNLIDKNGQRLLQTFSAFQNEPLNSGANGLLYNSNTQISSSYPRGETSFRVDYNLTDNTRLYVRYTRDSDQQVLPYGLGWSGGSNNIPFDSTIFDQAPAWNSSLNLTSTITPTLTNEFVFGASHNTLTLDAVDTTAGSFSGLGLNFALPNPYPANEFVNVSFGGTPNISFGGTGSYGPFPYKNGNTTFDIYDNISKVIGPHTLKAGIYYNRSRKDQSAGTDASISFSNNVNNPNNTGYAYANALLGEFDSFSEPNIAIFQGQYRSTNVEWYVQDNWKVNNRLTLDYGVRFSLIMPQYDARHQDYYFVPSKYDPSQAVRIYRDTCADGKFPCSGTDLKAYDPALASSPTAALNNPGILKDGSLVGRIVPNSGNPFNGIVGTGPNGGYYPGGIQSRAPQIGPAVGFAYDLFGDKKTVVRGGFRIAYDRVQGNELAFAAVGQPPLFINSTTNYGNIGALGSQGSSAPLGVSSVIGADPSGKIPSTMSYSLQVQNDIGWNTVVSVAYVGSLSRHQQENLNLNYSPFGTLFTAAAQDPAKFSEGVLPSTGVEDGLPSIYTAAGVNYSGANAYTQSILATYPGYGTIQYKTLGGSSNYNSLQVTVNKRLANTFSFGMAYTYSRAMGTSNGYGDYISPYCERCNNYQRLNFDRTQIAAINYDWSLPTIKGLNRLVRAVTNGWQVTGITQFITGTPEGLGVGITNINTAQRIGGSWTEPVSSFYTSSPQATQSQTAFFDYKTINLPTVAQALALQGHYPQAFVTTPGINNTDLSLFKNFKLGGDGTRKLQLRVEMFNVFNHPQFGGMNTGVTWNSFGAYLQSQSAATANINNVRGSTLNGNPILGKGVGEDSGLSGVVSGNRVIQLAVKIFF